MAMSHEEQSYLAGRLGVLPGNIAHDSDRIRLTDRILNAISLHPSLSLLFLPLQRHVDSRNDKKTKKGVWHTPTYPLPEFDGWMDE